MNSSSDAFEAVELLADDFVDRQRRGERPTIEEYVRKHPELAEEIREVFPALAVMEQIAPASGDLVQSQASVESPARVRVSQIGDYRILREIGRGGMGVVYEAEQESLRRRVALKVLPRQFAGDQKALERFQREARAAARMHHTNIVPVFEVGDDEEHVFYAMQLIQGQGLDAVIDDLKRLRSENSLQPVPRDTGAEAVQQHSIAASLVAGQFEQQNLAAEIPAGDPNSNGSPPAEESSHAYEATVIAETGMFGSGSTGTAVLPGQSEITTAETNRNVYYRSVAQIGHQTAGALAYAHSRGIIHRDIKPSNLLLDTAGVVWITDFGLAKTGDEALTHTGDILGTIRYMSPERFQGQCDVRADVYSLGLTLYEMLVLSPAFSSPDRLKLIEMVTKSDPPTPRSIDPRIPRDLETIVLKAIDKDPRRRYQSADDMADDLERFILDEPIQARRITLVERFSRWAKRNKALAGSLCTVATLLVVIAIGAALMAGHFRKMATENAQQAKNMQSLADDRERERKMVSETNLQLEDAQEKLKRTLYVADMQRVRLAYEEGAFNRMDELLSQYIPVEGEPDLRGLEWHYWWRVSRRHIAQLLNGAPLKFVVNSPDGSLVALRRWRGHVLVFDTKTERIVKDFVAISWDGATSDLAFSDDGKLLAAADKRPDDRVNVRLFRTADWSEMPSIPLEGENIALAFSSTGVLACADTKGQITFWDPERATQSEAPLETHQQLSTMVFSPDGTQLLTASDGEQQDSTGLVLWNLDDRTSRVLFEKNQQIASLAWTARDSGSSIAIGQQDGQVRLWNGETLEESHSLNCGTASIVVFSPDASRVAVAASRNEVQVWDTDSGRQVTTIRGHSRDVTGVSFVGDNERIWTVSTDGLLKTWDVSSSAPFQQLPVSGESEAVFLKFDANGRSLWHSTKPDRLERWDLETDRALPDFPNQDPDARFSFSCNDHHLVVFRKGSEGETQLEIWNTEADSLSLEWQREVPEEFTFDVPQRMAVSDDGRVVALCSHNSDIFIWRIDTDQPIMFTDSTTEKGIDSLKLSRDGNRLLINHLWHTTLWDVSGKTPPRFEKENPGYGPIYATEFSPDGKYFAQAHWNNAITLFDASTGEFLHQFPGHAGSACSLGFSPDAQFLASGGFDGTVRVWRLDPGDRELVLTLSEHDSQVRSVAFSPDGRTIGSYSIDGDLRLWKTATEKEIEQDPDYWTKRSWKNQDLYDWKSAYGDQTRLIQLDPENPEFYEMRGHLALALDRIPEAMSDFQTAITLGKVEHLDRLAKFVTWKPIDRTVSTKTQWRYTLQKPGADWQQPEYNDSAWKTGGPRFEAGIKNPDWPEQQIWLRTEFTLDSPPAGPPVFLVYADDEVTISLNGQPAGQANWIDTRFQAISSQVPFRQGRNVIAVHCRNVELRAGVHVIPGVRAQGEKLLAVLSAMLRSHPENESLLQQRAELYSDFEQWDKAAEDYVSFLKLRSQSPDWGSGSNWGTDRSNFLRNLAGNEELFEALRRQLPGDSDLWLARGRSLALRSDWDAAAQAFSQYSETPAADSEVWFEIACIKLINNDGYQEWLAQLMDKAGKNPEPFSAFILARTCGLAEQDDELAQKAVAWGEIAVSEDPTDWSIHALGLAQLRAGNLDEAERLFHQSMERNDWGKPQNELGLALVSQARGNPEQAEQHITAARNWIEGKKEEAPGGAVDEQSIDWIAVHALLSRVESRLATVE